MALTEEGIVKIDGLASRWVRLPGGAKAHYVTSGEDGPAVVLLHGGIIGSSGTAGWQFMAPFLAEHGFRVYCPDMPVFGLTEDPQSFYLRGVAGVDFIHDFTTALGLDQFHLAGNSMGCNNAASYVMAHPERVLSLALIAGRIGDLVSKDEEDMAMRPELGHVSPAINLFDGTKESMKTMLNAIIYRPDSISDDLLEMRTRAANHHWEAYKQRIATVAKPTAAEAARISTKGRLDKMPIPAICLYGKQDVLLPVELGYLQEERLPNVQFFFPDECGHQGQTDQPDMFNQVFLEFFRDGQVSRKTADWAGVSTRRPEIEDYVAAE